ncbi:major facilitator superfamily protein [Myriangium duriaei CBS 260.36]|uniref:Major facilitator superfamily protein n=1 Tax=Myriangium duriaei CBS 260.36 TaxID=1168546 RepID=A0A9P4IY17_9PEZI|nr:major facilitator superfamily protein [Myriangium duriaei CBS 260.36]
MEAESGTTNGYLNAFRQSMVVAGVALALFVVGLDMTIVAIAIPKITDTFGGIDLVGWYGTAFFISVACFQPFWGKAYQYFPLKYTFMSAVFVFEIGSLIAGVSPSSTVLIVGRALTGIGAAGIATGGYAIMSVVIRPDKRPIFTGLVTTIYSIANFVGPILGGLFAEHFTWRWCFYISLPVGGASAVIIFVFFRRSEAVRPKETAPIKDKLSQLDSVGTTLALASLIFFARALQIAGISQSWSSTQVIVLLIAFAVSISAFVLSQIYLDDRAMMVKTLLKSRAIIAGMLFGFFLEGAFYTLLYALPIYFQVVQDVSATEAGIRVLPFLISCGIGSFAAGMIVSRTGHYMPLVLWASSGGCVGTGLLHMLGDNPSSASYIVYQILAGLAYGTGLPLAIIIGQAGCSAEDIPAATAMLLFTFCFGSSLALAAAQSILDNVLIHVLRGDNRVDARAVIKAGAGNFRSAFPPDVVPTIVDAYLSGMRGVYVMIIALAGVATLATMVYKWEKLNNSK